MKRPRFYNVKLLFVCVYLNAFVIFLNPFEGAVPTPYICCAHEGIEPVSR